MTAENGLYALGLGLMIWVIALQIALWRLQGEVEDLRRDLSSVQAFQSAITRVAMDHGKPVWAGSGTTGPVTPPPPKPKR